jgi:hypothetical protein
VASTGRRVNASTRHAPGSTFKSKPCFADTLILYSVFYSTMGNCGPGQRTVATTSPRTHAHLRMVFTGLELASWLLRRGT